MAANRGIGIIELRSEAEALMSELTYTKYLIFFGVFYLCTQFNDSIHFIPMVVFLYQIEGYFRFVQHRNVVEVP